MKSFCIKTNNTNILGYLETQFITMPLSDIYFSTNKFKLFSNIIIHYKGKNTSEFINLCSKILTTCIITFYEDSIINRIINSNYFYFDNFEKNIIKKTCIETINSDYLANTEIKEEIWFTISKFLNYSRNFVLDGFVNFRIFQYNKYLDTIVDLSVNKYIIDREYTDFINLLKAYIDSKTETIDMVHLIYTSNSPILLDGNRDLINFSTNNIINTPYLSDITFSACDFVLNTLLGLLPRKIIVHLINEEDDFINSLKLIFSSRITICKECDICSTYSLLNKI